MFPFQPHRRRVSCRAISYNFGSFFCCFSENCLISRSYKTISWALSFLPPGFVSFRFCFSDDGGDYDAMETGSHTSRARLNQRGGGGYASQMGRRSNDYAASETSDISAGPEKWRRVRRGAEAVGGRGEGRGTCCHA